MGFITKLLGLGPKTPPIHVDDASFVREVLESEMPVLLDVWGAGCGPCKQLEPVILELATRYAGRVKVCEINASSAPRAMARLAVQSTPTVVYFSGGKELERVSGFRSSVYHGETIAELFDIH